MSSQNNKLVDEFYTLFQSIKDHNQSFVGNFQALNLPTVCVVGAQSHGKSSVLSNFAQIEVLPTDSGICTKGPIQIRIIFDETVDGYEIEVSDELNSAAAVKFFGESEDVRNEVKTRQQRLIEMGGNQPITGKEVRVNIRSNRYKYNLTLIDLPGLIQFDSKNEMMKPIRDLVEKYAKLDNSLLLVAHEASQNIENNPGLGCLRVFRPELNNIVIAVTKVDLITDQGQEDELKRLFRRTDLGNSQIFMVRNRTSKERDLGIDEIRAIEANFFVTSPYHQEFSEKLGVPKLTETLNELQRAAVEAQVPEIEQSLGLASRQLKIDISDKKELVANIRTWNDLMNEFQSKLLQAWGGLKMVLDGRPDSICMQFIQDVKRSVGAELDGTINQITNEIFKDGKNGWIQAEVQRQIAGASSVSNDVRDFDLIAINVSYQVIAKFEQKFKEFVLGFNQTVEGFLGALIDDVFGSYAVLAEIIREDVQTRRDEHEKRCQESVQEFFQMYQSINAFELSLELFTRSKPKETVTGAVGAQEEGTKKLENSVNQQVLQRVEAFIDVWSDILRLYINTYLRHQMVTQLIKNIQNNTRSTIDVKLAANEVTSADLDTNQDDVDNLERLRQSEEQFQRVNEFQKNLANMKRVYKIKSVVKAQDPVEVHINEIREPAFSVVQYDDAQSVSSTTVSGEKNKERKRLGLFKKKEKK